MSSETWDHSSIDRIAALDGLRGLAILLVLTFHLQWHRYGKAGVMLFFVLSGFLITRVLLKAMVGRNLSAYLKQFYIRRSLRILPLYLASVSLVALGSMFLEYPAPLKAALPYAATFTLNLQRMFAQEGHSLGHFWSLCVEEHFYLFWPLIAFFGRSRLRLVSLALVAAGPLVRAATALALRGHITDGSFTLGEAVYFASTSHIDAFAVGAFLSTFRLETSRDGWRAASKLYCASAAGLGISWLFCVLVDAPADPGSYARGASQLHDWQRWPYVWTYSVTNLCSGTLLLLTLQLPLAMRIFSVTWLRHVGRVSYGLYIMHPLVMPLLAASLPRLLAPLASAGQMQVLFTAVYAVLLFALAFASYRYFELPFLNLKDKFADASPQERAKPSSEVGVT